MRHVNKICIDSNLSTLKYLLVWNLIRQTQEHGRQFGDFPIETFNWWFNSALKSQAESEGLRQENHHIVLDTIQGCRSLHLL